MDYGAWGQFCDETCRLEFYHTEIRFIGEPGAGGKLIARNKESLQILKLPTENDVEIIKQLCVKFREIVSDPTKWHLIAKRDVFEIGDWRMGLSSDLSKIRYKYEPVIMLASILDFNNYIRLQGESEIDSMVQALENPL